jgi:hypothetical protein
MSTLPPNGTPSATQPASIPAPVVGAEFTLALAARRLSAMRWAALLGGEYDPEAYDSAVVEYRRARDGVVVARRPMGDGPSAFARAA